MTKWCEIFRAGTYKDDKGSDITYTIADIDKMISKFNEAEFPTVPIVVGHPADNSPAYGWVEALKREGEKLYASFKDVAKEFSEAVNKGLFKNRSISHYPDLMLRHIGFLGAMPPKVKGMEPFCFADDDREVVTFEFAEDTPSGLMEMISQAVNNFLKKECKPEIIAPYGLEFSERGKSQMKEVLETKNAELEAMRKEINELKARSLKKEFEQFAETLVAEGNIAPKDKTFVIDFLGAIKNIDTYDFSEGEEKGVTARFKEFLKGLKVIDFSQIATKEKVLEAVPVDFSDPDSIAEAIQVKIDDEADKGRKISAKEAVTLLEKEQNR